MSHDAPTDHPVHPLIARRHSPRAFADRAVDASDLLSILEAARWSASSFNEQPWSFIVATRDQPDAHARLLDCLVPSNQAWAGAAPVLMLSIAHTTFVRNDKQNRHAAYDTGQAVAQMVLEATDRGLVVHQMAGFDADRARASFSVPEGHEVIAAIALGHPGDPDSLPEPLRQRESAPRTRKPLGNMVFGDRFGSPPAVLEG